MLISFKNKQRKVASITLSMFMGSWLLLLCQTCFASNDSVHMADQQMGEMTMPCHESASIELDKKTCFGSCDCDELNVTINSETNSEYKEKIKYSQDLHAYVVPQITLSNRAPPSYRISTAPERATLLPFQHYTVLLI